MRRTSAMVAGMSLAATLVGCGSGGGSSAATVSPGPSAVQLSGDFQAIVSSSPAGALPGSWRLTFTGPEMIFENPAGAQFGQVLTYTSPNEFTVAADDCPTGTGTGHYRWTLAAAVLTLTRIDDASPCRAGVLTAGPWTTVGGS